MTLIFDFVLGMDLAFGCVIFEFFCQFGSLQVICIFKNAKRCFLYEEKAFFPMKMLRCVNFCLY